MTGMSGSGRQSHRGLLRADLSMVVQLSSCFLRTQPFNLPDGAGITDPNPPPTIDFLVIP